MLICGLKLTHDGGVAVLENNRLIFNIEMEKIANNARYTGVDDISEIEQLLLRENLHLADIDHFAVDGWGGFDADALALQPRLRIAENHNFLAFANFGDPYELPVARYQEKTPADEVLNESKFQHLRYKDKYFPYSSFLHVTGHLMGAYASSPFAARKEPAYILVWDGGMYPRLYHFDPKEKKMQNLGPLFLFIGNIYSIFSQHFGPFRVTGNFAKDSLSVAGKVMAYIALGNLQASLFEKFDSIYHDFYTSPMGFANIFTNEFKRQVAGSAFSDEDILASFHAWLGNVLVEKLQKKVKRAGMPSGNLCLAGGCALNIKWNSQVRNTGFFHEVYVPPFPNDSGSALGTAAALAYKLTGKSHLDWNVYSGAILNPSPDVAGWKQHPMTVEELGKFMYQQGEPVVFLNGRAELGPRALGNRSILASPIQAEMKDLLNKVKGREGYRPVSPICLEEHAAEVFAPGSNDPYMLFDHMVKSEWTEKIPAVMHLDGSARLQTVDRQQHPVIHQLLTSFHICSGIPLLCNTSANHNGKGFFPDVESAAKWGKVNYIWSENILYEKEHKEDFAVPLTQSTVAYGV